MRDVVITGIGIVSPIGTDLNEVWRNATLGVSGIRKISLFDACESDAAFAGEAACFHPEEYFPYHVIKSSSRYILMARIASRKAMKDSELSDSDLKASKAGVIIGSSVGGVELFEKSVQRMFDRGVRSISPFFIISVLSNIAGCQVGIDLGLKGTNYSISTACASGADAIGNAYRAISDGYADLIVAGGSEAAISKLIVGGFSAMRVLYEGHSIEEASIPFDKRRSGFVIGEGACCMVLEEKRHAIERGARIYAEIAGYDSFLDAVDLVAPSVDGIYHTMRQVLETSGIDVKEVEYINAHGTSTVMNDYVESVAIRRLFGDKMPYVSSTKSLTGHMLGAAGAFEAALTALSLYSGELPINAGFKIADENCGIKPVTEPMKLDFEYAISNSLGFGGHNTSLLLKKLS